MAAVLGLALGLVACQTTPAIDMIDARVTAGAGKTCAELELSSVRCTLLTLRAAKALDEERPNHARVTSQAFHEAGEAGAGQSAMPDSIVVPGVVVFTLDDGTRVGVPLLCPRQPDSSDQACNPRVQ